MWSDVYKGVYDDFTIKYGGDLIGAFRSLQDSGCIEIATCGATHGYFPLLSLDTSVQAPGQAGRSELQAALRTRSKRHLASRVRVQAVLQMEKAGRRGRGVSEKRRRGIFKRKRARIFFHRRASPEGRQGHRRLPRQVRGFEEPLDHVRKAIQAPA